MNNRIEEIVNSIRENKNEKKFYIWYYLIK